MEEEGELHSHVKGVSIPVPNVQALAESLNSSTQVPKQYLRAEIETQSVFHGDEIELPVIDFGKLFDEKFSSEEAAKLHSTCKEWGFFSVNHGVSEELLQNLKADVADFFKIPLEEKIIYKQQQGSLEGYGQAFVLSEEQKLEWCDMLYLITRSVSIRNTKFWPASPSTFRDTVDKYSLELKKVANCLFDCISKNLGINPEDFIENFKDLPQGLKFNYYPPCPEARKVLGAAPHSDAVGLTILLQINDVQGLQIRKDGKWITVNALSNALIINIGDIVEILSNGIYKSVKHRAIINNEKERLSVVAFHGADQDFVVRPLKEIVGDSKPNYRSVSYREFMRALFFEKFGNNLPEWLKL